MVAAAVVMMQVTVSVQGGNTYHDDGCDGPRSGRDDDGEHGDLMCAV